MSAAEPPAGPRGNPSRLEGAPRPRGRPLCCGEKLCDVRLGHCAAAPPLAPGCRWRLNSGMTQIFRNQHSLESPPLITVEGTDTRNCLIDRNSCTLCERARLPPHLKPYTNSVICQQGPIPTGSGRQMCIREHKVEAPCFCGGNDLFLTRCCLHIAAITASFDVETRGSSTPGQRRFLQKFFRVTQKNPCIYPPNSVCTQLINHISANTAGSYSSMEMSPK